MREGALAEKLLPDGREIAIYPLTFGRARIAISESPKTPFITDSW